MQSKAEEILHRLGYGGMLQTGIYIPNRKGMTSFSTNPTDPIWPREAVRQCKHEHVSRGICMNQKCNREINPFTGEIEK